MVNLVRRWFAYSSKHSSSLILTVMHSGMDLHYHSLNHLHKNIKRHTAHTIVSWPNPNQWIIVHTSDLMMFIIRQSNIFSQPSRGNRVNWKNTAPYIEKWIPKRICSILLTHSTKYIWQTFHEFNVYEVRDLFPWEMITKLVISCLLNVEKIRNSGQINLSSTLNVLPKILFRRNNIHREIDHWNRRWFGAKWHVTVPNSVAPVKLIVCKWIYMLQE